MLYSLFGWFWGKYKKEKKALFERIFYFWEKKKEIAVAWERNPMIWVIELGDCESLLRRKLWAINC